MTIVLCGGGSGGHITPLLAVARELRSSDKNIRVVYVGEKRGKFSHIAEDSGLFDECHYISAGKLRRYHNESLLRRITDIKTIFLNLRDGFKILAGTVQAYFLFRKLKPGAVLLKGGYVCVPASIGANSIKSFIVTHDSDALPGMSNRFAARFARVHATGMPEKYYSYPKASIKYVGLPVDPRYKNYTESEAGFLKEKYGLPKKSEVVLVVGGSNGAKRLNQWCLQSFEQLLSDRPNLYVYMIVGKGNLPQIQKSAISDPLKTRIVAEEFTSELFHLGAIADVVVTRAGATALVELAAGSKACIIVPNPDLTGGHQLKNAKVYEELASAIVVQEKAMGDHAESLAKAIEELLSDPGKRELLGKNLNSTLPKTPAAKALADILIKGSGE